MTIKEFLDRVVDSSPVPGGGGIAILNGVVASVLIVMVAELTVGEKRYEEYEELMEHISRPNIGQQELFVEYIDHDSRTYDRIFGCFRLPKTADEEKAARSAVVRETACFTTLTPMQVARSAYELMEIIADVTRPDSRDAITDVCIATVAARSAVSGVLPDVRINLASLEDTAFVDKLKREACCLEQLACMREKELFEAISQELNQ